MGVTIRWTVGDVSPRGFQALRLSILGAQRTFGSAARLAVCVNSLSAGEAMARTGPIAGDVEWHVSDGRIPGWLHAHLDSSLAEGVAWKFAPMRLYPDDWEISVDNDCLVWAMPEAVCSWLRQAKPGICLLAEDVAPAFGQFASLCPPAPRNSGVRGLPPGFDLESALAAVVRAHPVRLVSELDEQGLQVAALSQSAPCVVSIADVAICSPFPPHASDLGRCGAHFVGLNVHRERPYCDRATMDRIADNWDRLLPAIEGRCVVGGERAGSARDETGRAVKGR